MMLNEETKAAPKPILESALEKDNLPWLNAQASAKPDDLCWVQPPDAENRMSGGGEGLRGEIPVSPSDPLGRKKRARLRNRKNAKLHC